MAIRLDFIVVLFLDYPNFANVTALAVAAEAGLPIPGQGQLSVPGGGLGHVKGEGFHRKRTIDIGMDFDTVVCSETDFSQDRRDEQRRWRKPRINDTYLIRCLRIEIRITEGDAQVVQAADVIHPGSAERQRRAIGGKVTGKRGVDESRITRGT